jgi:hypothetical protein
MKSMRPIAAAVCTCALAFPLCITPRANAQPLINQQDGSSLSPWTSSDEILISGTADSVDISKHTLETPAGVNVRISSAHGDLNANLGSYSSAQSLRRLIGGRYVTLTGILRTWNGNKVLLVHTLNLNGQSFVIRNAHGIPMKRISAENQTNRIRQGSFGGAR